MSQHFCIFNELKFYITLCFIFHKMILKLDTWVFIQLKQNTNLCALLPTFEYFSVGYCWLMPSLMLQGFAEIVVNYYNK